MYEKNLKRNNFSTHHYQKFFNRHVVFHENMKLNEIFPQSTGINFTGTCNNKLDELLKMIPIFCT